ncbi:MAG: type ISP restriction/modification enzyme [Balneola sp.]|jgi:predicted helicase
MSFKKVLEKYRAISFSERDKGDRFERLMQAYLKTDPKWTNKFSDVWLWNEFVGKKSMGGKDTGIDLVAKTNEGDYWAIQCKCYAEDAHIDKPSVDSFLSTSSREFKNEHMITSRFSHRLWIETTGKKWGVNAEEAIRNQTPPVSRISLFDLIEAPVDWDKLEGGIHGEKARIEKFSLRPHQKDALDSVHKNFLENDRGKLIMACGTGKTFTALRIAEHETEGKGLVLFLVPSIALLGQTLREWSAHANEKLNAIAICSDPKITKQKTKNPDTDALSIVDLAYPASTDPKYILKQFESIRKSGNDGMTVVFSTYQSIEVIAKAQEELLKNGFPEFDLIICDEAHRTTGVSLAGEDESAFVKVHDNEFIKGQKRLYMTATPRLYSDDSKSKAAEADAVLCSMDDAELYGEEVYRIGFGEAVQRDLLTDYKVLILTLNDKDVPPSVQRMLAQQETEISTDDATKLIGTVNALSKQFLADEEETIKSDPNPMKRAVAFCPSIKASKSIRSTYNTATDAYLTALPDEKKEKMVSVSAQHMDGTMAAPERDQMLSWLKEEGEGNECRVVTNVRVLSEGVDVPSLDAVLFLSARNSQVDVVQSVGRVMRKAPGKNYGYIIIPVVVPSDVEADKALDDNERYKVVWTVLNALRAHDDRFNATVNKIELNKRKPTNILVGRPETTFDEDGNYSLVKDDGISSDSTRGIGQQIAIQFEELQDVIFARMVQKVGNRRYWEQWAKDVAQIAERQIERIQYLITQKKDQRKAFDSFLAGLQKNINPSITEAMAVEMLAQHIITKPIFEALFEGYSFVKSNAVSTAMQGMMDALEDGSNLAEQDDTLQKFYDSVRKRAEGIDNAEGKQRVIVELYDKFFKTAFPTMVEQLGIVYTPVEVVDFIILSVNDVLKQEFGRSISDESVHILDPFTGTGTFITRLLQSGLIKKEDLERKYRHEIHANEIVLLAYYIAAVNVENVFHDLLKSEDKQSPKEAAYEPFEGIVLTDTFQLGESDAPLISDMFPKNSERVDRQKNAPVKVIMGNPPYSIGQKNENDAAQNQSYQKLDRRISETYASMSNATNKNALYDSYIKAYRWSADRLDPKKGGIIAFVSNSTWLDGNSQDGFRKVLENEFSSIWVFDLRGNQRTSGELSRKEGGKIFGSGSRTPIAITLLVKNPKTINKKATINYYDIGDYKTREEKLKIISKLTSINSDEISWENISPNKHGDWLNKRNDKFGTFVPIAPEKKIDSKAVSFFTVKSNGVGSSRDFWVFNYSKNVLKKNIKETIVFYNKQVDEYSKAKEKNSNLKGKDFIDRNAKEISWSSSLIPKLERGIKDEFIEKCIYKAQYRPFQLQYLYFGDLLIHRKSNFEQINPDGFKNMTICVGGKGNSKPNCIFISDSIIDYNLMDAGSRCFPLYYYEKKEKNSPNLFDENGKADYLRKDGISDFILERAIKQYSAKNISKEDIFYYVYGVLHNKEYRVAFENDMQKMLPRIPLVDDVRDFWSFSKAGRELAYLHINYEQIPPYEGVEIKGDEHEKFKVQKMRFAKKKEEIDGKTKNVNDKSKINYSSVITISNIPEKAYDYIVNGRSAIEWIMDRYQINVDLNSKGEGSGIKNDPNDWAEEVGNPRYILNLLLSVINVSVQTVDIVNSLPKLEFED